MTLGCPYNVETYLITRHRMAENKIHQLEDAREEARTHLEMTVEPPRPSHTKWYALGAFKGVKL